MTTCDRSGACCEIEGRMCPFLATRRDGMKACALRERYGSWRAVHASARWRTSPAGIYFARHFPGYGCGDFPEGIPAIMDDPHAGKCCWEGAA